DPVALRVREVLGDPRPQLLRLEQRELVLEAALVPVLAVERAGEPFEVAPDIPAVDRPDHQRPLLGRQRVPVLLVQPCPAVPRRRLGVEDQAVEIEEKGTCRHRGDGIDGAVGTEMARAVHLQPEWLRLVPTDKRLPEGARVMHVGCGTSCHAAQTGGLSMQALEAVLHRPDADILVCVSHEGETELTLEAARAFPGPVWLVTGKEQSPLASLASEVVVCTPEIERSWCHTASYTCAVAALRVLHGEEIGELPRLVEEALTVEPELPTRDKVIVLGAGHDWPTAQEAVLKLREGAWVDANAHETEQLR